MKAYELIEKYGWKQGSFGWLDPDAPQRCTGFCLLGAIRFKHLSGKNLDDVPPQLHEMVARDFGEAKKRLGENPVKWNDAYGRTKEEVIALLKELDI